MKTRVLLIALTGLLSLIGCSNDVSFSQRSSENSLGPAPVAPIVVSPEPENPVEQPVVPAPITPVNPVPIEPPPVPIPVVPPPPVVIPNKPLNLKSGTCAVGAKEQVLSCLSCQSIDPVFPPPLLSRKARELLDIMTVGCSIHNASDPIGYIAPTKEELLARLIQCSPITYQDTAFEATQANTIKRLLTDATTQYKTFSGLYYNHSTTDFETYFGIDIGEARHAFCMGYSSFGIGGIYPKEYYDSIADGTPYFPTPIYVKAQRIRGQLRSCLVESLKNPNPHQDPVIPGKTCSYESAEGEMSSLVVDQVNEWKKLGHTVYFEGFNQCGIAESIEQFLDSRDSIKLAIKKCQ